MQFNIGKEIALELASRFDLEFEESQLTDKELLEMNNFSEQLNNKEWKLYAKYPKQLKGNRIS